jgi:hypothetical protein
LISEEAMFLGVDFANYTPVPSPAQVECWWRAGVRFAIVGCQRSDIALAQVRALQADGRIKVEAYQFYYWDGSEAARTAQALEVMGATGLTRLWIDVEWAGAVEAEPGPSMVLPALDRVVEQVEGAGFVAGIYTSARFWASMAGNSSHFAGLPLWHADYRSRFSVESLPDFDRDFREYGGWSRPTAWQWAGSVDLCGLNVDMNASDAALGRSRREGGPMRRHNASAFGGQTLRGRTIIDVRKAFGLPPARMVRLELMLARPGYVGVGDGAGGPYAGSLREGERHAVIDVLATDGNVTVDAPDGAEFEFIGVLGYWE